MHFNRKKLPSKRVWDINPLTRGWQNPYSVQHSAQAGQPSVWSMSSIGALKGAAGHEPAPTPAPRQPAFTLEIKHALAKQTT